MKHLFIVNPTAGKIKGRLKKVVESIHAFFIENPHIRYDIHISRWERDAMAETRLHAEQSNGLLRVHVLGGSGTLHEVINAAVGLPNIQIAAYPFGNDNNFLQYFGTDKIHLFSSILGQVFSGTTPIDVMRCGHRYGITYGLAGVEAFTSKDRAGTFTHQSNIHETFFYIYTLIKTSFGSALNGQDYRICLDGNIMDGTYISMLIANVPSYGKDLSPAVEAHPNDGFLEVYITKRMPRLTIFLNTYRYLSGNYEKIPHISRYRGKKVSISSENNICLCLDGQVFYANEIDFEIIPYAIDFVCPSGIDVSKLPRIYGKPDIKGV
jgi:diacylglycerol kinase (ATP)